MSTGSERHTHVHTPEKDMKGMITEGNWFTQQAAVQGDSETDGFASLRPAALYHPYCREIQDDSSRFAKLRSDAHFINILGYAFDQEFYGEMQI
jgi:hypothetical protein